MEQEVLNGSDTDFGEPLGDLWTHTVQRVYRHLARGLAGP